MRLIINGHRFTPAPSGTTPLTFSLRSGEYMRPNAGVEEWGQHVWDDSDAVSVPLGNSAPMDMYWRFKWRDFETTTAGVYSWTRFNQKINYAIDNGMKFNFSVMPIDQSFDESPPNVGGFLLTYPDYLHTQMQAEVSTSRDWGDSGSGMWVPNWNSTNYLTALENLCAAIYNHIQTTSYSGVDYKDAVGYVDIRGYGNFGEWHNYPYSGSTPSGRVATVDTLKTIIDIHTTEFPDLPLLALSDGFANWGSASTPDEVVLYLINASNVWGPVGWRRDNWGNPDYDDRLLNNPVSYLGQSAQPLIMARWETSPIGGEPWRGNFDVSAGGTQCPYYDLTREINLYHPMSFGNGNYESQSACMRTNIRNASFQCGYKYTLTGGELTTTITPGGNLKVVLDWKNVGIAPTYENWNVVFELKNSSDVVLWSGTSSKILKRFKPAASSTTTTDNFLIPSGTTAGPYKITVRVDDPTGFRNPMPLHISTAANADGSYTLRSDI